MKVADITKTLASNKDLRFKEIGNSKNVQVHVRKGPQEWGYLGCFYCSYEGDINFFRFYTYNQGVSNFIADEARKEIRTTLLLHNITGIGYELSSDS